MRITVIIQNLKCESCRHTVLSALENFESISSATADISTGSLSFDYASHNAMEGLRIHLAEIGHPIIEDPRVIKDPKPDTGT